MKTKLTKHEPGRNKNKPHHIYKSKQRKKERKIIVTCLF